MDPNADIPLAVVSIFDATDPNSIDGSSAGVLAPNIEAKIVNPEGKLMPPGEIGELLSRSPSNALGCAYSFQSLLEMGVLTRFADLANEKATKETFDDEGFVHTGDECYISKAGWLFVVDRIKELIKVKGMEYDSQATVALNANPSPNKRKSGRAGRARGPHPRAPRSARLLRDWNPRRTRW